ncbi:MAG: discoidin domain-containing protein [Spirochaetes bacterium]|nr:discoidin domain-containing protein [Spirochaetota bacterium]
MRVFISVFFISLFSYAFLSAVNSTYPIAVISNGRITATVYLPDPTNGHYLASRFNRSSMAASVIYDGHHFFGNFIQPHSPDATEGASGFAEEFSTPVGYDAAAPGGTFLKIGVGVLIKPDTKPYDFNRAYAISDGGRWAVNIGTSSISFSHYISSGPYQYHYRRRMSLSNATVIITHELSNSGFTALASSHYAHNFILIDGKAIDSAYEAGYNFNMMTGNRQQYLAAMGLNSIRFLRPFEKTDIYSLYPAGLLNNSNTAAYVYNSSAGAGIIIRPHYPVVRPFLFAVSNAVCPEFFFDISCASKASVRWSTEYDFVSGARPAFSPADITRNSKRGIAAIMIDGNGLAEYTLEKRSYSIVQCAGDTHIPRITAEPSDPKDSVRITQPSVTRAAVITYIAADNSITNEYTVALKKSAVYAVSASMFGANPPINTLDEDLDTSWSAEGEQWISYDFGTPHGFTGIGIAWRSGNKRYYRFSIETGMDGKIWNMVFNGASGGRTNAVEPISFARTVNARYIRIRGSGNNLNRWNNMTETIFLTPRGSIQ